MPPENEEQTEESIKPRELKPLEPENLGLYAPFEVSDEPMYGPDELGPDAVAAIKSMIDGAGKYEDAARVWEVIQAAEARLFDRGYQWLTNGKSGGEWVIAGTSGPSGVGAGAITTQDKGRMWALNIYGARKDKIVSALTVKDPEPEFFPKNPQATATDGRYAEEADSYKHLWKQATNVRKLCGKVGGLFYTDDRTALITESIADAQKFGMDGNKPGIQELTRAYGKLEFAVPMSIDEDDSLPWCKRMRELDVAVAKEKFSWIKNVSPGTGGGGAIDRTCRLTVRNAVSNQTVFAGNAADRAVTEATWWVRPSQYRDVVDDGLRKMLRSNFRDGMRIVTIGGEFAYCRNEKMDDCVIILYSREGTGQNRRAIGTNNITTQKILNYDFNLLNRYMTACVPRKLHDKEKINSEAIQQSKLDPSGSIGVMRDAGEDINSFTGMEQVPTPPPQLMELVTALTDALPEVLDGAGDAMWGGQDVTDTAKGITIQRDQALQVFGPPYNALTWGIAISCGNAAKWAGRTRTGMASGMVSGVGRISVDFAALANGEAYCFPEADSGFPESEAEKDAKLVEFVDGGGIPTILQAVASASNYESANRITKRFGIEIPGVKSVRKQMSEFELILKSVPQDNPAYIQAQGQIQQLALQAQVEPDAQTPEGQQAMQQAQQAVSQIPPQVCSVPVEQNASVNHQIEAEMCFEKINSEEGQKLKREQPLVFENLMLHWQGHTDMAAKLAPKSPPQGKASANVAIDKLGPQAQSAMLEAEFGVTIAPEAVQPTPDVHEITQEKEGVDDSGVPVKQKISYSGKALE